MIYYIYNTLFKKSWLQFNTRSTSHAPSRIYHEAISSTGTLALHSTTQDVTVIISSKCMPKYYQHILWLLKIKQSLSGLQVNLKQRYNLSRYKIKQYVSIQKKKKKKRDHG